MIITTKVHSGRVCLRIDGGMYDGISASGDTLAEALSMLAGYLEMKSMHEDVPDEDEDILW